MSELGEVDMHVCQDVAMSMAHCSIDESCYKLDQDIQLVRLFSTDSTSRSIVNAEPVQIGRHLFFQSLNADGFSSTISADGREEKVTSAE